MGSHINFYQIEMYSLRIMLIWCIVSSGVNGVNVQFWNSPVFRVMERSSHSESGRMYNSQDISTTSKPRRLWPLRNYDTRKPQTDTIKRSTEDYTWFHHGPYNIQALYI